MKFFYKTKSKIKINRIAVIAIAMLLLACGKTTTAQVAGYSFTQAAGTYTTVAGTTFVSGAAWDDDTVTVALPFTFTFNNTAYNQVSINDNGLLSFNYFSIPNNVCGLQSTNPPVPANTIAGYGTDLHGASAASSVQYTTVGSAPNRQFVVQWTDCDHYKTTAYNNHINFQIRLTETTNTVQVIWGTVTMATTWGANTCSDAATESGSVGLMGNSTADFNIRKVTNGTNTWAASVAGTLISDVCNLSAANKPALGLTYTWTPPAPSAMTYVSSTTLFLNNGQLDGKNSSNSILQVQVVTNGALNPLLNLTSLSLSTTGSTNPTGDIADAKVYFTGASNTFSTSTQFGSTTISPNGAYVVNGNVTLAPGTNYFWVVYDISSTPTIGDLLKGCCTQIVGSGNMGTQVPTITCPAGSQIIADIGHWVPLANPAPHGNGETLLLMSDGTVLAHTFTGGPGTTTGGLGYGSVFDRLTPDTSGSYVNGTWSTIAPMISERLAFSSAILKDGRVYCAGGEYGTDGTQAGYHGEVYNPLTDAWTSITGINAAYIFSDGNEKILENGNVLQAGYNSGSRGMKVFNPTTMAYTTSATTLASNNESEWVKLPDNTILYVNSGLQTSERYHPTTNNWLADANCPVALYDPFGLECGPAWLLPNGKVFFIGGTGHTAIYTPSGTAANGTWTTGPDLPSGRGMPDAPGAMMINGKIIIAVSAIPTAAVEFATPTYFYEYDYTTNAFTEIGAPGGGLSRSEISQSEAMLVLPDGTILEGSDAVNSNQYYVYFPAGPATPASWKPVISTIAATTCPEIRLTGIRFNGMGEGSQFGDEGENDTNYPIVRLTSTTTGRVYYGRSYNWNSTGVQRGNLPDTTYFTPPAGLPAGNYQLAVSANGIISDPVTITLPCNVLPVTLLNFTAQVNAEKTVKLAWQTAQELNTSSYIVERGTDGVHFTALGSVASLANNSSANNYTFPDNSPFEGINYYRLKIVDVNSNFKYSNVVTASIKHITRLSIFPNPAYDVLNINSTFSENVLARITDVSGRKVKELNIDINSITPATININNLTKGVYFITFFTKDGTVVEKFLKN